MTMTQEELDQIMKRIAQNEAIIESLIQRNPDLADDSWIYEDED